MIDCGGQVYIELWTSLASLLRSYAAVHGLGSSGQAMVELSEERILICCGEKWLNLEREGATVNWKREDGSRGTLELTGAGRLRCATGEEEMDLVAEAWARELMRQP